MMKTNSAIFAEEKLHFDYTLFADRKEQTKLVTETVRAKRKQVYLAFTGVAGQGKSEFLKWICYQGVEKGLYYSAYIDLEDVRYHRPEIHAILEDIVEQLHEQTDVHFTIFTKTLKEYKQKLQKVYRDELEEEQTEARKQLGKLEEELSNAFNEELLALLRSQKVVLCLDSTEEAYKPAFHNFERLVLAHYLLENNFTLITAGQKEVAWETRAIKEMIERHPLPPMDFEGLHAQIDKLLHSEQGDELHDDSKTVLKELFEFTAGHPLSNYKLVEVWTEGFKTPLQKPVDEQLAKSIHIASQTVIEERILKKFQLSEKFPLLPEILWYLAPLRHIELSMLQHILTTFLPDWFGKKSKPIFYFQELMGKFQRSNVFSRWEFGRGFDIDPAVRNILLWDMRLNAHEIFISIQSEVAEKYHELIPKTTSVDRIKNIVERLYHRVILLSESKFTDRGEIHTLICKELQAYLDEYFPADPNSHFRPKRITDQEQLDLLDQLYYALEYDKELSQFIEVEEILSPIKQRKDILAKKHTEKGGKS